MRWVMRAIVMMEHPETCPKCTEMPRLNALGMSWASV